MKFTAQEEYGLRCILHLVRGFAGGSEDAASHSGPPLGDSASLTVSEVAEREALSEQYVGKFFRVLASAGLVESVRGCKGGYRLARAPEEIHVAETLAALGGKIFDDETCGRFKGKRLFCVHSNDCSIRSLWTGIQLMVDAVLSRTTLRDLVGNERTMAQWMNMHVEALNGLELSESTAGLAGEPAASEEGLPTGVAVHEIEMLSGDKSPVSTSEPEGGSPEGGRRDA